MSRLSNFGEQFAAKVLEKTYQNAVVDSIVNRNYEGEIKKPGDRVNILSFLNSITLGDYVVGTDMASEAVIDSEDQLIVEKRKFWNFSLDRLEDIFTYADNIADHLANDGAKVLEKEIDTYVLGKAGDAKVGNHIGVNLVVVGGTGTMASIATTATGGTLTITTTAEQQGGLSPIVTFENPVDGASYSVAFNSSDLGKGIRLRSTAAFVSPWYRISGITSSSVVTVTEWDEATSGSDFEEGYTLRGTFGGDGVSFPKGGSGDSSLLDMASLGWEIQAAVATTTSASNIYNHVTMLAEALDQNEVENVDRHITVPPQLITQLKQSSQLQPTGIAEIYTGNVLNGRVMRVGAFDIHMAAGSRVSTRAGRPTSSGTGADTALTATAVGYQILANHIGFMTYADKWTETRVVDAENQFAKKYQGLFLYGALVPKYRRKYGAILFTSF